MAYEGETKEENGTKQVYFKGTWHPLKQPKQKEKKDYPLDVEVKVGEATYRGKARTDTYKWVDKKGNERQRKGFAVKLDEGQTAYGGGNIFLRI